MSLILRGFVSILPGNCIEGLERLDSIDGRRPRAYQWYTGCSDKP